MKKKNSLDEENIDFDDLPSDEFSTHDFMKAWENLSNIYKNKNKTLYIALTKNTPSLKNNIVELLLDNLIQETEINEKRGELLSFLRKQLNNYSVKISTKLAENKSKNEVKKAYLPEEKISLMIDKKPEIKRLLDDLDLEIKQ